jgi:tetratricopeptide (TPR) repeat protein
MLIAAALLVGCATSSYRTGDRLLRQEKYEEAVTQLRAAASEDPQRAEIWQKLGIAYYHLKDWDQALQAFKQANLLDPQDGPSMLYRGMIQEELGQIDEAKNLYRTYLTFGKNKKVEQEVRYRLRWLEDTRLKEVLDNAIKNEKNVDVSKIPQNAVAVVSFDASSLPEGLAPIGRGLAELIYNDLSYVQDLRLVERLEIARLQQELELSQSAFADKMNSPRVGKIVGAGKIVTGKIDRPAGDEIDIDCGIVDVGPGVTEYPKEQQGQLNDFFEMQKKLTLDIVAKLGYEITPALRNRIDSIPTSSFLALIAYSRGLGYADRGLYALAEAEFKTALNEDPKFGLAQKAYNTYSGLADYNGTVQPLTVVAQLVDQDLTVRELSQNQKHEIIQRLQGETRTGVPEEDEPYTTPEIRGGTVIVTGRTD